MISAKKKVAIDYSMLTKPQLFYLVSLAMGAKLPLTDRPNLSEEVMKQIENNHEMARELVVKHNCMVGAAVSGVTPISWDEQKLKISHKITSEKVPLTSANLTKEGKDKIEVAVEKVDLEEGVFVVPRIHGVPQTIGLATSISIHTTPFSAQAVNAAIAAGNLTERTAKGTIDLAVGVDAMKKLKIPFLTEASLLLFSKALETMLVDMKPMASGVHGLEWMNMVYNHLISRETNECFYTATSLLGCLFGGDCPFVRKLTRDEFVRVTMVHDKAKVSNFRVQHSVATLASVAFKGQMTYLSTLVGCIDSRNFRKTDGRGMSGANQGAYTGEFQTKATRTLRGKLTMVHNLVLPKDMPLYIYTEDAEFLRHCVNHISDTITWFAVTKVKMDMPKVTKVTMVPSLQNKAVMFFPEDALPNLLPKHGFERLVADQKESISALLQPLMGLGPAVLIYPTKVLDLEWNPQRSRVFDEGVFKDAPNLNYDHMSVIGPAPHNLEYYKIVYAKTHSVLVNGKSEVRDTVVSMTTPLTKDTYLKSCNIANSYRNTWFLHRVPLDKIFAGAKIPYVEVVPLGKKLELKPLSYNQLLEATVNGSELSSEDLLRFYAFQQKERSLLNLERNGEDEDSYDSEEYEYAPGSSVSEHTSDNETPLKDKRKRTKKSGDQDEEGNTTVSGDAEGKNDDDEFSPDGQDADGGISVDLTSLIAS